MALVIDYTSGTGWESIQGSGSYTRTANPGGWDDLTFHAGGGVQARWILGSAPEQYTLRAYVTQPTTLASGALPVIIADNGNAQGQIVVSGSGNPNRFRYRTSGSTDHASSPFDKLIGGTTYRVELQIDTVNSKFRAGLFDLYSDTPSWVSGELTISSTAVTQFRIGRWGSSSISDVIISRFAVSDTYGSWIGRHSSDYIMEFPLRDDFEETESPPVLLDTGQAWVVENGTWSQADGALTANIDGARIRTELGDADQTVEYVLGPETNENSFPTILMRHVGASNSYWIEAYGSNEWRAIRCVRIPGRTTLWTTPFLFTYGKRLRVAVSGDDPAVWRVWIEVGSEFQEITAPASGSFTETTPNTPSGTMVGFRQGFASGGNIYHYRNFRATWGVVVPNQALKEILGIWNGTSLDEVELMGMWNGALEEVEVI